MARGSPHVGLCSALFSVRGTAFQVAHDAS
eukprot:SAG25_NODE_12879_length_274_cov_0.594286_1_plen_29_part_10